MLFDYIFNLNKSYFVKTHHIKNDFETCTRLIKPASASVMRLTLKGKDISSVMGNDGLVLLNTRSVR